MFENYCQCCFAQNILLLPLIAESSNDDGKTLGDYLNIILPSFVNDNLTTHFICLRCSKALQVSYHFINMIKETAEVIESCANNNKGSSDSLAEMNTEPNEFSDNQWIIKQQSSICNEAEILQIADNSPSSTERHSKLFKRSCVICHKRFDNKQLLSEHNQTVHKELIPFKCKMCNYCSCYPESLFKHYRVEHDLIKMDLSLRQTKEAFEDVNENPKFELSYKCLKCNFESCNESEMADHSHGMHDENDLSITELFKCPSCHRTFSDLKSVKIHYTMYHHNSFFKKRKIADHKNNGCEKCGAAFDLKSGLRLHKLKCDMKAAVNCNFCDLKFSTVLKYEQHLQTKHAVAIKHECEMCGKVFRCSEYLAIHRKRHNERYYQCDLCPNNYISNAELRVHKQRNHNKLFAQLVKEKSIQMKASYYKCTYCNFGTCSRYYLKVHQYSHNGGKPYKCRLCSKEFVYRKHLREHCENLHLISITNDELANMFKEYYGYASRFDAFSKQNNNLEINAISNSELEKELQEFGLTLQDIMDDLFVNENEK